MKEQIKYSYKISTTFEGKDTTMGPYSNRRLARKQKQFLEGQKKFGKVVIVQSKTIERKVR